MQKRILERTCAVLSVFSLVTLFLWWGSVFIVQAVDSIRYVAPPPAGNDMGNNCAVPATPCATIQHAVDVADPGDELHVAGGTYSSPGPVIAITKELRIIGAFDPGFNNPDPGFYRTVLEAQGVGSVVSITNAGDVLFLHLTLIHGDGTGNCGSDGCGGGIYATGTALHIGHCVISNNVGTRAGEGMGGGLFVDDGELEMWDSEVISNTANVDASSTSNGRGGGLYALNSPVSLRQNQIVDNVGHVSYSGRGGGAYLYGATYAEVLTNVIRGNKAGIGSWGSDGGGLLLAFSSSSYVAGNRIEGNWTNPNQAGFGGGIYVWQSDAHLARNRIINNATGQPDSGWVRPGGGVAVVSSKPVTLSNNLIVNNDAGVYGGGVFASIYQPAIPSRAILANNTIVDNGDSGVMGRFHAALTLTNNLIAGHATGLSTALFTGTVSADTNLFWNDSDPITGINAIVADPLLTADYHLGPGSPAADVGLPIPWLPVDLDGEARPQGTGYDLGAFEGIEAVVEWRVHLPFVRR